MPTTNLFEGDDMLDDWNYYNDPRVVAAAKGSWFDSFNEQTMRVMVTLGL